MSNIALPYTQIIDPASFKSILNAKIYIGEYGVLPNPANSATWKQAYFVQDDGSRVAASQPIRTNAAGFAVDGSGNIRTVQVDGQYSILVQDGLSAQKYSNTRVNEYSTSESLTVDAITAVNATGLPDGIVIIAKGRGVAGDGGGGVFRYSASSVQTADGVLVFAPTSGSGRLFRDGWTVFGFNGPINVKWAGAKGDAVTPDSAAIQLAINAGNAFGGGLVYAPVGRYKLDAGLIQYANVELIGDGPSTVFEHGDGITAITATGTVGTRLLRPARRNFTLRKTGGTTGHHIVDTLCDYPVLENIVLDGTLGSNPCYVKQRGTRFGSTRGLQFINGSSIIWTSDTELTTGVWGEDNVLLDSIMDGAKQGYNIIYQNGFGGTNSRAKGSTGTFGSGFVIEFENIGVTLVNCVAHGHVRAGFYVEGNVAFGCKNIRLISCEGYNNGECGLNLDANFRDVQVIGGSYHSNTGTFAAGTGHGILGAGSQFVTITGATLRNNAGDAIKYFDPLWLTVTDCMVHDNTGWFLNIQGSKAGVRLRNNTRNANTAGDVNNWSYIGNNEWDDGPFEAFTPTFYKSDESTTFTLGTLSFVFKRLDGMIEYSLVGDTPSSALNGYSFFSLPVVGSWPDNSSGAAAQRPRGMATMDSIGTWAVDGTFSNGKLRISKTDAATTQIRATGRYEVV